MGFSPLYNAAQVAALTAVVATKASTVYVDAQVSTLNTAIAAKANTTYVDAQIAAVTAIANNGLIFAILFGET